MDSRRRGATWLLAALVIGRALDALDLPFERRPPTGLPAPAPASAAPAASGAAAAQLPDTARATPAAGPVVRPSRVEPPLAGPIRVNRATAVELQRLPGVGPVLAARIVAERRSGGPFRSAADLRRVQGIGAKTSERLAPHLRFD